jgi:hypothetical protein
MFPTRFILRLLIIGIASFYSLGFSSESPRASNAEIIKSVQTALAEAETLGLPSLAGATLFEGEVPVAEMSAGPYRHVGSFRHVHARLPDGSWLIDLVVPLSAERIPADKIAALKPFVPWVEPQLPYFRSFIPRSPLLSLAEARRYAVGVPEATEFLDTKHRRLSVLEFYPRPDWSHDAGDMVRFVCRDYFLAQGHSDAALAITPPRWRDVTKRIIERKSLPEEMPPGPSGQLAFFQKPGDGETPIVDVPLLPEISDATLVSLAGDRSPALACVTVGEVALYILGQRWGFDPALLAGRDIFAPFHDIEQDAIAAGLATWWKQAEQLPSPERWMIALKKAPVNAVLLALSHRHERFNSRRFLIKDRLLHRTWRGNKPPELLTEKYWLLMPDYLDLLLARWDKSTVIPAEMDAETWGILLGYMKKARFVARENEDEEDVSRKQNFPERLDSCIRLWPRAGVLRDELLVWDDQHGRHEELNVRVKAALAQPNLAKNEAMKFLSWWVKTGTAERWQHIAPLLERAVTDPLWQALVVVVTRGDYWYEGQDGTSLQPLIVWRLLHDERPLPAGVLAGQQATYLEVIKEFQDHFLSHEEYLRRDVQITKQDPGPEELTRLRRAYALEVKKVCEKLALPIPENCLTLIAEAEARPVHQERQISATTVTKTSPNLTPEEAQEIRAVLADAVRLGFPDLSKAKAVSGEFPHGNNNWSGVHICLADGSWLAESVHPIPALKLAEEPIWLQPIPGTSLQCFQQLPAAARGRISDALGVGPLGEIYGDSVLPALIWWLSGVDSTGSCVVAAVFNEAVLRHDVADTWSVTVARGGDDRGDIETVPTIPDGVRRSVARWFRHQAVWAQNSAEVEKFITAAQHILPSTDQPTWEPMLSALRARITIPQKAAPDADLIARLQSWKSTRKDVKGKWIRDTKVPAKRSDTDALVALLDDNRPTRWVSDYAIPRPLGDVALEALGELWHCDWRWLVVNDPAVAAILPPRKEKNKIDRGDEWLWASTAWTAERRAIIMPAIKSWWKNRTPPTLSPLHAIFRTLPLSNWDDVLRYLPANESGQTELGDIFAERLRAITPPDLNNGMEHYIINTIMHIAVRQPQHAGIKAVLNSWAPTPWLEAIAALQAEFSGDSATFDRWMHNGLNQQPAIARDYDPTTPWKLVGIWVHRPTPQRLAALRKIIHGDINDPRFPWLASQLGQYLWLGNWTLFPGLGKDITRQAAQGIPCALAQDGLNDQRIITATLRQALLKWIDGYDEHQIAKQLPHNARICDWTATILLNDGGVLDGNRGNMISQKEFLTLSQSKRDDVITELKEKLKPIANEKMAAAKLIADPAMKPDDVKDF